MPQDNEAPLLGEPEVKQGRGRPKHYLVRMDRGLQPWMKALARRMASAPVGPTPKYEQVSQWATELAGKSIPRRFVRSLLKMPAFIQYQTRMEESVTERARQEFEKDYDYYVAAHKEGLKEALAEKDYRAVTKFTTPVLDRIAPKRVDMGMGGQTIVIQVTGAQADRLNTVQMAEIVVEQPEVEADDGA